jgi:hypothetical protein
MQMLVLYKYKRTKLKIQMQSKVALNIHPVEERMEGVELRGRHKNVCVCVCVCVSIFSKHGKNINFIIKT